MSSHAILLATVEHLHSKGIEAMILVDEPIISLQIGDSTISVGINLVPASADYDKLLALLIAWVPEPMTLASEYAALGASNAAFHAALAETDNERIG